MTIPVVVPPGKDVQIMETLLADLKASVAFSQQLMEENARLREQLDTVIKIGIELSDMLKARDGFAPNTIGIPK
jgi:hypothetical protein